MPDFYLDLTTRLRATASKTFSRFAIEVESVAVLDHFHFSEHLGGEAEWTSLVQEADTMILGGTIGDRWKLRVEISATGRLAQRALWQMEATYVGEGATDTAFNVVWDVHVADTQPFVPGVFYGENRPRGKGGYPRWSPDPEPDDVMSSAWWTFRADRSMTPVVMLNGGALSAGLATPERFSHGGAGLGFSRDHKSATLSMHFPYREEPRKYVLFPPNGPGPEVTTFHAEHNEVVTIQFETYAGHAGWRALLRDLYDPDPTDLHPWLTGAEAADLAAYGLQHWHFDAEKRMLNETAGFDRYFSRHPQQFDRANMHVAWNCGVPYALALARHGERAGNLQWVESGLAVIDHVAEEAVSPSGVFYPQWTAENGWTGGWHQESPAPPYAQSRTVAEATWFFLIAMTATERLARGERLASWERAVQSNLDYAVKIQREDGSFGTYYHLQTGEVMEWEGAGGLMWIPALLAGARYANPETGAPLPDAEKYKAAALKAGEFYARLIRTEKLAGAPEDVPYGVTSEDGYNALFAMLHLYEATGDESWCDLASHAADYAISFRMSYNATFSETTLLGRYDFRSKGADIASPSNQHLHSYGLICLPELLRLWRLTEDEYYFDRARDHLFCWRQFIAREDGDFNARKGMVSEQWFHTDWTHPKGYILPLAHAWCAGLIVWAEDCLQAWGNVFIDPTHKKIHLLEALEVEDVDWTAGTLQIRNPWPTAIDLTVVNLVTEEHRKIHITAGESMLLVH